MKRSSQKPQKSPHQSHQQLRIIGGQWRGRKLSIAHVDGLRPTGDRIRETLFNWLMHDIVGSRCLDLFSGSGALGFEALSRGADSVVMIEKNREASALLKQHGKKLEAPQAHIIQADALAWLNNDNDKSQNNCFDIVFIDPPFALNIWQQTIELLDERQILAKGAMIYIETPTETLLNIPQQWQLHREKRSGAVCYRLFQCL